MRLDQAAEINLVGKEVTLLFAPANATPRGATFPHWRVKIIRVSDHGLVVEHEGQRKYAISWQQVAAIELP